MILDPLLIAPHPCNAACRSERDDKKLWQASLRMEQALWPEEFERMTREVEEALREADDPNAKSYTHEEVMQAMQERIDRARDKPC